MDFKAKWIDIKGFREFKDVKTKGIDRPDAAELMKALVSTVPDALRSNIGAFRLKAAKNFAVRVPVDPDVLDEVKNTWTDHLKHERST